jgi:hypothetical protein
MFHLAPLPSFRSAVTNMSSLVDILQIDAAGTDFENAFDRVNNYISLSNFNCFDISLNQIKYIAAYFLNLKLKFLLQR